MEDPSQGSPNLQKLHIFAEFCKIQKVAKLQIFVKLTKILQIFCKNLHFCLGAPLGAPSLKNEASEPKLGEGPVSSPTLLKKGHFWPFRVQKYPLFETLGLEPYQGSEILRVLSPFPKNSVSKRSIFGPKNRRSWF